MSEESFKSFVISFLLCTFESFFLFPSACNFNGVKVAKKSWDKEDKIP